MLRIAVKHLIVGLFEKCCNGNWSAISVESCTWSQNKIIPSQPGAITRMRQLHCLIFWITVKESGGRVSISSETRPVNVQSIYVPSMLVWDWRYVQWNFVVQISGKQIYMTSEQLLTDLLNTCRCSDHSVDWTRLDLNRRLAITFRHPAMCLALRFI